MQDVRQRKDHTEGPPSKQRDVQTEQAFSSVMRQSTRTTIIKHIEPRKLSQRQVYKHTFPGKRAENIEKEIFSISQPQTNLAGTCNLPTDTAKQRVQNMKNSVGWVQNRFPNAKIGISGVIVRFDIDAGSKVHRKSTNILRRLVSIMICFILTTLM